MNRRTILKSILAAPVALKAQVEETPKVETMVADVGSEPVVRFFSREQFTALTRLSDMFEPSTAQTPGAKEARAAEFLDFLLSESPPVRQSLYRLGLDRLNTDSAHRFNQPFSALDAQQAEQVLSPLRRPWTYEDPSDPLEHFLREAKTDISEATHNSYEFISAASKRGRRGGGVGEFWYPIY